MILDSYTQVLCDGAAKPSQYVNICVLYMYIWNVDQSITQHRDEHHNEFQE